MTAGLTSSATTEARPVAPTVAVRPAPAPSHLAPLTAASAAGLLLVAVAFAAARASASWADPVFWLGLAALVLPIAFRLLGSAAGRRERLGLVVVLGLALYAVKLMHSPEGFTFHDELGHVRGVSDILRTGRLYVPNPLVAAYSYYPGIQVATAAVASVTGLGIFASGVLVVGLARLVLVLALFGFVERVSGSARAAGIAVLVYASNPNFLFFDAQFAYESLAIALAAACLLVTAAAGQRASRPLAVLAAVLGAGTVVSHHLTSYALVATLCLWAVASVVVDRRATRWPVVTSAAVTLLVATAWWLFAGDATGSDIGPGLSGAASGLFDILTGQSGGKRPFTAARGYSDPPLEQLVGLASVGLLLITLPAGLLALWRARRRHAAVWVLAVAALAYPATLALRLTAAGTETSNRASEFVFVGLGAGAGLALVRWVAPRIDGRGRLDLLARLGLATMLVVLVFGGLVVGWPGYERLPGSYLVAGDARSVSPQGIAAARWAGRWLPRDSQVLTDGTDKALLVAYGGQDPQGGNIAGQPIGAVITAPSFTPAVREMLLADRVRFIVIDRRLSDELPRNGRYFDSGDPTPGRYTQPVSRVALAKFDQPGIDRIYSNGDVVVYDAHRLLATR